MNTSEQHAFTLYNPRWSVVLLLLPMVIVMVIIISASSGNAAHAQNEDVDYALQFDGASDFVELGETLAMMGSGWEDTKTVSLWVKPTGSPQCTETNPSPAHCDAIFGDRPRWWGISRGVVGGQDRIWVWNYDGGYDQIGIEYTVDEWVHIALVHENGTLRAYKNGVEVGSGIPSGSTMQPSTGAFPVLHIGGIINNEERNWTFPGQIDELRVWNIARTEAEIAQDMNHTLAGSEAGLVAYYQMSDGSGIVLTDDSRQEWDGAMFGPPTWVTPGATDGSPGPTPTPTPTPTATPVPSEFFVYLPAIVDDN